MSIRVSGSSLSIWGLTLTLLAPFLFYFGVDWLLFTFTNAFPIFLFMVEIFEGHYPPRNFFFSWWVGGKRLSSFVYHLKG